MVPNPRPRILCVDDDEGARSMLVTLLEFAAFEAKAVGTAAQALSIIQTEPFDLYMLEAWLPEVDGFELCRQMRAVDAHIPILFFSGAGFASDKQKGIDAGADDYVIKPDIQQLLGSIEQFTSHIAHPIAQQIHPKLGMRSVSGLASHAHERAWIRH